MAAVGALRLVDIHQGAAVDRQGDAGDEIGLVGGEEQRRIGDVPGGAHFSAQRHARIAGGGDLGAALAADPGAGRLLRAGPVGSSGLLARSIASHHEISSRLTPGNDRSAKLVVKSTTENVVA